MRKTKNAIYSKFYGKNEKMKKFKRLFFILFHDVHDAEEQKSISLVYSEKKIFRLENIYLFAPNPPLP